LKSITFYYHSIAFIILLLLGVPAFVIGQVLVDHPTDSTQIKEYEKRIRMPRIDGKYIPKDLTEALTEIDKFMEPKARDAFKQMSEDDARRKTHFNFGRYLMLRWGMVEGSRLNAWFIQNKIFNVDDMVDCVITAYHRQINNQPIQFEALAQYYYKKQKAKTEELVRKQQEEQKKKTPK